MTAKSKKPARPRKPRQQRIPGTEGQSIPEIDEAAAEYKTYRDARMAALKEEVRAGAKLLELMHRHHQAVYDGWEGYLVTLDKLEKVKVKSKKDREEENGEG